MLVKIGKTIGLWLFAIGLLGCSFTTKPEVQTIFGYSMGTSYSIKLVSTLAESRSIQIDIESELSNINQRMSTYLPRSDLSVFSMATIGENVTVDPKTALVVNRALEIAEQTSGYFDPTVAPLVNRWGFGPTPRNVDVPTTTEISELLVTVGYQALSVDMATNSLLKTQARELDLSAIAKGYAVDRIASLIEARNIEDYLVEVGGEMRIRGVKPDDAPWRIAIEKPVSDAREPFRILEINNMSVATSGDYRNFYELDGQRFSHTIDPQTGYPVEHDLVSATVVMARSMDADAFATAFMAMGQEKALEFANINGIAALFIFGNKNDFQTTQSDNFTRLFGQD